MTKMIPICHKRIMRSTPHKIHHLICRVLHTNISLNKSFYTVSSLVEAVCHLLRWTSILSKLEKSLKIHEHKVVFLGNVVPCNNTLMWKHNQLCNIVESFKFMPVESEQNSLLRWESFVTEVPPSSALLCFPTTKINSFVFALALNNSITFATHCNVDTMYIHKFYVYTLSRIFLQERTSSVSINNLQAMIIHTPTRTA